MPLDWLNTPLDADISELLARKRRAKAIEELKAQLQRRAAPPPQVRLQLADLLAQAGRAAEAVPVLIGLADEFAGDGFVAKAIAILKRVERVEPGRADVASRLALLVQQQKITTTTMWRPARPIPELGMEEISDAPPLAAVPMEPEASVLDADTDPVGFEPPPPAPEPSAAAAETTAAEPEPPAAPAEPPGDDAAETPVVEAESLPAPEAVSAPEPSVEAAPPALEATEAEAPADAMPDDVAVEAAPLEPLAGDAPSAPAAASPKITQRIRGVFRRFLAALPGAHPGTAADAPHPDAPPDLAPDEAPLADAAAAAPPAEAVVAPEPGGDVAEGPVEEQAALTAADFQDRLLDVVEDLLQRPAPARSQGRAVDRSRVVVYAQQLLAMPLFGSLTEEELMAVVRGLRLHVLEPGDIAVTEGEAGQSLFLLPTGQVKVFIRNPAGRNFEVAELREGQFFGEISSLSGRPRTATVVAATLCELLELDKPALDAIARSHPRVCDVLESFYIERASSPEAAAVRAVPLSDGNSRARAIEVLEAHFGESRWDPRMRLRLADLLLKAGKEQDALPILVGLADELAREGYPEKAVAILKKIEQVRRRHVEVVNLAPLARSRPVPVAAAPDVAPAATAVRPRTPARTDERFHGWLLDVVRGAVGRGGPPGYDIAAAPPGVVRAYGPGLVASPLFQDFSDDELLAFIQGLRLLTFVPGDVIITEGEPGQSLFILTTGAVRVFVRDAAGHNVAVCALGEGSFFGEISTLSGRPRSATITAASHCELLEMDRATLDVIAARHPRVREVLEEFSIARATDPRAASIRGDAPLPS
jgi:CRP-like cAMP-binding protein